MVPTTKDTLHSGPLHSGPLGLVARSVYRYTGIKTISEWEERTGWFMALLGIWTLPAIFIIYRAIFVTQLNIPPMDWLGFIIIWGAISTIFSLDYLVRMSLSHLPLRFVLSHPLIPATIIFPAFRLLFSHKVISRLFQKGSFKEFMFLAGSFVIMGAFIVQYFERGNVDATIITRFDAFWWAIVTSTTVGYGDTVPVTTEGRGVAIVLILVGLLLYSTLTARIAESFLAKEMGGGKNNQSQKELSQINNRLERIEKLLEEKTSGRTSTSGRTTSVSGATSLEEIPKKEGSPEGDKSPKQKL